MIKQHIKEVSKLFLGLVFMFFAVSPVYAVPTNGAVCGDGIKSGSETCDDGNTVSNDGCSDTCTLEGHILIKKVTNPNTDSTTSFSFHGNAGGTIKNGGSIDWGWVSPGSYTIAEDDPAPKNYTLHSITCNDAGSATPSVADLASREVRLNLDPGENLICTFSNWLVSSNDPHISLTVCKVKDADGNLATTGDRVPVPGWMVTLHQDGSEKDTEYTGADGCFTWVSLPYDDSYPLSPGHDYGVSEEENVTGWQNLSGPFHDYGIVGANTHLSYTFANYKTPDVPEFGLITGIMSMMTSGGVFYIFRKKA